MRLILQGFGDRTYVTGGFVSGPETAEEIIARRKKVLKPRPDVPLVDMKTGLVSTEWDRYFQYTTEVILGGVLAPTLLEVHAVATGASVAAVDAQSTAMGSVAAVNTLHADVATQATDLSTLSVQANANADSIAQTITTVQAAALPGSGTITPPQHGTLL